MAVSDTSGLGRPLTPSRYDLLLAVIPVVLLVGAVGSTVTDAPAHATMGGVAFVAALAVFDALFVNPPGGASGP